MKLDFSLSLYVERFVSSVQSQFHSLKVFLVRIISKTNHDSYASGLPAKASRRPTSFYSDCFC